MIVLGIEVDDALVAKWRDWYAPEVQPYFVDSVKGLPKSLGGAFSDETSDTFKTWKPSHRGKKVVWYDEETARDAGFAFHSPDDAVTFVEREGLPNERPHPLVGFPSGSGPNCFGAAMGLDERVLIKPFTEWLHASCRRGGKDVDSGTVLVWRDTSTGDPFHAAITLGDGWAFEKGSQCWWSPRYVTTVAEVKRVTRMKGLRLERWRLRSF